MKLNILVIVLTTLAHSSVISQSAPVLQDGLYTNLDGSLYSGSATLQSDKEGIVSQQYIEVDNGLLHGVVKYFHSKGYLEETGSYTHGKKDGVWAQYAANGQQLGEAHYNEGKKDGIWTVWDEQGVKRYHMVYSMGKKVDTWKMWNEHSTLVSERFYNE